MSISVPAYRLSASVDIAPVVSQAGLLPGTFQSRGDKKLRFGHDNSGITRIPWQSRAFRRKINQYFSNQGIAPIQGPKAKEAYKILEQAVRPKALVDDPLNSYERLEYLGDKVLALHVSKYLMNRFSNYQENELTHLRQLITCNAVLAITAKRNGLKRFIKELYAWQKLPLAAMAYQDYLEAMLGAFEKIDELQKTNLSYQRGIKLLQPTIEWISALLTCEELGRNYQHADLVDRIRQAYLLEAEEMRGKHRFLAVLRTWKPREICRYIQFKVTTLWHAFQIRLGLRKDSQAAIAE